MAIVMIILAIGAFAVLLYKAAIYALPFAIALWAGSWAYSTGAGVGCVVVALIAGAGAFVLGQLALRSQNLLIRWIVVLLFVVPAVVAGYSMVLQLSEFGIPSLVWRHVFAFVGAVIVGWASFARLIMPAESSSLRAQRIPMGN